MVKTISCGNFLKKDAMCVFVTCYLKRRPFSVVKSSYTEDPVFQITSDQGKKINRNVHLSAVSNISPMFILTLWGRGNFIPETCEISLFFFYFFYIVALPVWTGQKRPSTPSLATALDVFVVRSTTTDHHSKDNNKQLRHCPRRKCFLFLSSFFILFAWPTIVWNVNKMNKQKEMHALKIG